jgi:hypothetical protein
VHHRVQVAAADELAVVVVGLAVLVLVAAVDRVLRALAVVLVDVADAYDPDALVAEEAAKVPLPMPPMPIAPMRILLLGASTPKTLEGTIAGIAAAAPATFAARFRKPRRLSVRFFSMAWSPSRPSPAWGGRQFRTSWRPTRAAIPLQ